MAHNPFETIDARLSNIENLLLDLKHPPKDKSTPPPSPDFPYNPLQFLFDNKIISKPTFYKGVKEGKFQLIKLGSKSFIDMEQFLRAFHKVKINNK